MNGRQAPIFIVGVPRSGTTLLASLLAAHRRLHCGPETHFFEDLERRPFRLHRHRHDWPEQAADWLLGIQHVGGWVADHCGLTRDDLLAELRVAEQTPAGMLRSLTEPQCRRAGKERWVEKTPNHVCSGPTLRRWFPRSPVIRITRDPRDTILSLLAVPWGPKSLGEAVVMYRDNDEPGERFFGRDPMTLTIRYEDLLLEPRATLTRLCSFVGETFDERMLEHRGSISDVNRSQEPWKTKSAEPMDPSRVGAWRRVMSTRDARVIECLLGNVLDRHSYERTTDADEIVGLDVWPLRGLSRFPGLLSMLADAPASELCGRVYVLGDPDPQRMLDEPKGWRPWMLVRWTVRLLWRVWIDQRRIVWCREPASEDRPGRLARVAGTLLALFAERGAPAVVDFSKRRAG
jgi:hypothetical protein